MEQEALSSHSVTLERRKRMMVTGVLEVLSATDKCVIIRILKIFIYILNYHISLNEQIYKIYLFISIFRK